MQPGGDGRRGGGDRHAASSLLEEHRRADPPPVADVVEYEHASCDVDLTAEHVLGRRCVAELDPRQLVGEAQPTLEAGGGRRGTDGNDHTIGSRRRHVTCFERASLTDLDAEPFELPGVPGEVVDHLRACRLLPGEAPLAAELVGRLDQHDAMAALGAHARGLESCGATADDEHVARIGSRREPVAAPLRLAPDRWVDQARDPVVAGPAAPAQLVARDARADPLGVSGAGLGNEVRVGDLAAHDRHHVGVTGGEHRLGGCRRADVAFGLHDGVAHDRP